MIVYKRELAEKLVEAETFCNCCGHKIERYATTGHLLINFCYGSKKDGDRESLHVCEQCYEEFVAKCKIKPATVHEALPE